MPFRAATELETSHEDIERRTNQIVDAGVMPLSVGGDHSISHPILKAVGKKAPVGLIHIDAHCDTSGLFDMTKFHHGGPFRNAVLDGVLDPSRTIQIGIRGSAEYLWNSPTIRHDGGACRRGDSLGFPAIEKARRIVGDSPPVSFDIDSVDPASPRHRHARGRRADRGSSRTSARFEGSQHRRRRRRRVAPQYDATTNTAHAGAQVLFNTELMVFSPAITGKEPDALAAIEPVRKRSWSTKIPGGRRAGAGVHTQTNKLPAGMTMTLREAQIIHGRRADARCGRPYFVAGQCRCDRRHHQGQRHQCRHFLRLPPFSSASSDMSIKGYDIDVAQAIADSRR